VLRLARLAVDERAQGRGVGRVFLKAVFGLAKDLSQDYGCVGVVVDATPEAITFDQRYGFIEFSAGAATSSCPKIRTSRKASFPKEFLSPEKTIDRRLAHERRFANLTSAPGSSAERLASSYAASR